MNEPLQLTKQTFEKEVLKAARPIPGADFVNSLETWRSVSLKILHKPAKPGCGHADVLHLWSLGLALEQRAVRTDLNQLLAQPDFTVRLDRWFDETQSLISILSRFKKIDLGQLANFLEGSAS